MSNGIKAKADTITDLTGYTCVFNESFVSRLNGSYFINFISNNSNFTDIFGDDHNGNQRLYYDNVIACSTEKGEDYWKNQAYKTIQITGGNAVTNSTLIAWLEENGTLTAPTPTPTGVHNLKIGGKTVIKKMIGNKEVLKQVVNGVVVYEKGGAPISLANFTLSNGDYLKTSDNKYFNIEEEN